MTTTFNQRLKEQMKKKNIGIKQLARWADINQASASRIVNEERYPSIAMLVRIASALEVDPIELGGDELPNMRIGKITGFTDEQRAEFDRVMNYLGKSVSLVKELWTKTNLTRKQFAKKYHVSSTTLDTWMDGRNNPPSYVAYLLTRAVNEDYADERNNIRIDLDSREQETLTDGLNYLLAHTSNENFSGSRVDMKHIIKKISNARENRVEEINNTIDNDSDG